MTTERTRRGAPPAKTPAVSAHDVTRQSLQLDASELEALRVRLRKVQGQVGAVLGMLDEGRECRDVVHVLAAASGALNRAGFLLLNKAMRQCAADPGSSTEDLAALEKLFLELA